MCQISDLGGESTNRQHLRTREGRKWNEPLMHSKNRELTSREWHGWRWTGISGRRTAIATCPQQPSQRHRLKFTAWNACSTASALGGMLQHSLKWSFFHGRREPQLLCSPGWTFSVTQQIYEAPGKHPLPIICCCHFNPDVFLLMKAKR